MSAGDYINVILAGLYAVVVFAATKERFAASVGAIAFLLIIIADVTMQANWEYMKLSWGYDGACYRWQSVMAIISFTWWLLIQRTTNIVLLVSVSGMMLIDASCMVLGPSVTQPIAWAISSATVVLHIAYCYGCAHGGFSILFDDYSHDKSDLETRGGDK